MWRDDERSGTNFGQIPDICAMQDDYCLRNLNHLVGYSMSNVVVDIIIVSHGIDFPDIAINRVSFCSICEAPTNESNGRILAPLSTNMIV